MSFPRVASSASGELRSSLYENVDVTRKAAFIEPMLLLQTTDLPDGPEWLHELKLDGYRAVAFKSDGKVHLRSRNDHDFTSRCGAVIQALFALPDETVVDGEIVAVGCAQRHPEVPSQTICHGFTSGNARQYSNCEGFRSSVV